MLFLLILVSSCFGIYVVTDVFIAKINRQEIREKDNKIELLEGKVKFLEQIIDRHVHPLIEQGGGNYANHCHVTYCKDMAEIEKNRDKK